MFIQLFFALLLATILIVGNIYFDKLPKWLAISIAVVYISVLSIFMIGLFIIEGGITVAAFMFLAHKTSIIAAILLSLFVAMSFVVFHVAVRYSSLR